MSNFMERARATVCSADCDPAKTFAGLGATPALSAPVSNSRHVGACRNHSWKERGQDHETYPRGTYPDRQHVTAAYLDIAPCRDGAACTGPHAV